MTDADALIRAAEKGTIAEVKRLFAEADVDASSADEFGFSALHGAAKKGHASIVELLLERGAHADARAGDGCRRQSPLHYACRYGHLAVAKMLLAANADPAAPSSKDGKTPMDFARGGPCEALFAASPTFA